MPLGRNTHKHYVLISWQNIATRGSQEPRNSVSPRSSGSVFTNCIHGDFIDLTTMNNENWTLLPLK